MRIALARRGYSTTGGAEAYLRRLAQGLLGAGEEVVFYTSNEWPEEGWPYGEIRRISGDSPLTFARSLQSQKQDFDCLLSLDRVLKCNVYRAGDGVHAAWLYRRAQFEPPWRHWLRSFNPKHAEILKLEQFVFNLRCTGVVVVNSHMVREEILEYYGFPEERIVVVPNGFRASPILTEDPMRIRSKYGFSSDQTVVLFAGTGWERKGLRFAVQAVDALKGRAKLLVVGQGPAKKYASCHTVFAGPVSDMTPFYAAADIFFLPTIYDPFSNACLEAFAAGLPVITTCSNGFSDLLQNKELGDVLEAGDVDGLVEALERWLPEETRKTTRETRLKAAAKFPMEENIRRTLDAIRLSLENPVCQ